MVYTEVAHTFLRCDQLVSLDFLRVADGTDFQRELCAFVLLSEDHWDFHPGSGPPDLR